MNSSNSDNVTQISEVYHFDGYRIFKRDERIIQLEFDKGFMGTIIDAQNMIETFKKIKGPEKVLLLVIYEEDNTFSKETREYIAGKEVSEIIAADALVIKGLALRIIGNGYLRINKPNRPTRLFNSDREGYQWLKQFIDQFG